MKLKLKFYFKNVFLEILDLNILNYTETKHDDIPTFYFNIHIIMFEMTLAMNIIFRFKDCKVTHFSVN